MEWSKGSARALQGTFPGQQTDAIETKLASNREEQRPTTTLAGRIQKRDHRRDEINRKSEENHGSIR